MYNIEITSFMCHTVLSGLLTKLGVLSAFFKNSCNYSFVMASLTNGFSLWGIMGVVNPFSLVSFHTQIALLKFSIHGKLLKRKRGFHLPFQTECP